MHQENIFSKEKVHFNLVKYNKFGKNFELVVDPDLAIAYKMSKLKSEENLREILRAEKIFSDAKKGSSVDEKDLITVFGTSDFFKIARKMVDEGEIQLTAEYREKLREEKRKKIIQLIHRMCIDPRTNLPHPVLRIENAMNEARVKIDEYQKAEDQMQEIISKLKPIIPIKVDEKIVILTMPVHYASKLKGILAGFGTIEKEDWLGDDFVCRMKIPAGIYMDLIDELNKKTHGSVDVRIEK
ncbi:MAG: ribosome assembly factor SBDS [Candidatus Woesearchaeota archaeon]|jgi:ribosome maturation protein SDO1